MRGGKKKEKERGRKKDRNLKSEKSKRTERCASSENSGISTWFSMNSSILGNALFVECSENVVGSVLRMSGES